MRRVHVHSILVGLVGPGKRLNFRPRYLVIDELDKTQRKDFSVLLSLMQSGVVARLKKGMREVEQMVRWVFAGCNRQDRLPPELLSWFVEFQFTPYSREEFIEVAAAVVSGPLGKDPSLAVTSPSGFRDARGTSGSPSTGRSFATPGKRWTGSKGDSIRSSCSDLADKGQELAFAQSIRPSQQRIQPPECLLKPVQR